MSHTYQAECLGEKHWKLFSDAQLRVEDRSSCNYTMDFVRRPLGDHLQNSLLVLLRFFFLQKMPETSILHQYYNKLMALASVTLVVWPCCWWLCGFTSVVESAESEPQACHWVFVFAKTDPVFWVWGSPWSLDKRGASRGWWSSASF